jgi:hypothetical protein
VTPALLVESLERRGLRLKVDGTDLVVKPQAGVTPQDIQTLKAMKPGVIAYLRGRDLGVDWSTVALAKLDRVLELEVPGWDAHLILAPGCRIARELRAEEPKPGRVWCVCEVLDLLLMNVPPDDARRVAEVKFMLGSALEGTRTA